MIRRREQTVDLFPSVGVCGELVDMLRSRDVEHLRFIDGPAGKTWVTVWWPNGDEEEFVFDTETGRCLNG